MNTQKTVNYNLCHLWQKSASEIKTKLHFKIEVFKVKITCQIELSNIVSNSAERLFGKTNCVKE